jgi:hypothetical protein
MAWSWQSIRVAKAHELSVIRGCGDGDRIVFDLYWEKGSASSGVGSFCFICNAVPKPQSRLLKRRRKSALVMRYLAIDTTSR